jgi:hypothetical protein
MLRIVKPGEERIADPICFEVGTLRDAVVDLYDWQHRSSTGFFSQLYNLMQRADDQNLTRLALAFPYHAIAFDQWRSSSTDREFFESHGFLIP